MKKILLSITAVCMVLSVSAQRQQAREQVREDMYNQYGKENAEKMAEMMKGMMNAKVDDSYTFPIQVNMRITGYDKKMEQMDMSMYVNPGTQNIAMRPHAYGKKQENVLMVYDNGNKAMVMLDMDKKTGMAMSLDNPMIKMAQQHGMQSAKMEKSSYDCNSSGKTKTIHGYNTSETVCTDDKGNKMEIWVTKQVPVELKMPQGAGGFGSFFDMGAGMGGMMMEASFYENGNLQSKMEITEINKNANYSVKTTEYKMGMAGME